MVLDQVFGQIGIFLFFVVIVDNVVKIICFFVSYKRENVVIVKGNYRVDREVKIVILKSRQGDGIVDMISCINFQVIK